MKEYSVVVETLPRHVLEEYILPLLDGWSISGMVDIIACLLEYKDTQKTALGKPIDRFLVSEMLLLPLAAQIRACKADPKPKINFSEILDDVSRASLSDNERAQRLRVYDIVLSLIRRNCEDNNHEISFENYLRALAYPEIAKHIDRWGWYDLYPQTPEEFEAFGAALKTNTFLVNLDLGLSNIGPVGVSALAEALLSNTTLRELCLSYAKLDDAAITPLWVALQQNSTLKVLDLSNNKLSKMTSFTNNRSLTDLNLSHNCIDDDGGKILALYLHKNSSLRVLEIGYNRLGNEAAQYLSVCINNSNLEKLDLEHNSIKNNGFTNLGFAIQNNEKLKKLSLEGNDLLRRSPEDPNGFGIMAVGLAKNRILNELDLSNTEIDPLGLELLADIGLKCNRTLKRLTLIGNQGIDYLGTPALATLLAHSAIEALDLSGACFTQLSRLDLSGASTEMINLLPLVIALKQNSTLKDLILDESRLNEHGVKQLAEALMDNSSLEALSLYNIAININGARSLARALTKNTRLTSLNVASNRIGDRGVEYLAQALKTNRTLQVLDLAENRIGDRGVEYLAQALKINSNLRELVLSRNDIGDLGAQTLAGVLKGKLNFEHLEMLNSPHMGDVGVKALAEAVRANPSFYHLTLSELGLIGNDTDALIKTLKKDPFKEIWIDRDGE